MARGYAEATLKPIDLRAIFMLSNEACFMMEVLGSLHHGQQNETWGGRRR